MDAQQRIDAIVHELGGGDPSRIGMAFVAMPLERGVMVQHDAKTVNVSQAWVDEVDDDLLRHAIVHEHMHRGAFARLRHEMAGDAVVDWVFDEARSITSAGNVADETGAVGEMDQSRFVHVVDTGRSLTSMEDQLDRFLHLRISKGETETVLSFENDLADGRTAEERFRDVVERMTAAGYEVGGIVPSGVDLSESMVGHFDGPAISAELDAALDLRLLDLGRRDRSAMLIDGGMPLKRAARTMLAAGAPMAETFSRQDENDRWNRSQGRRGGGGRKGR